MLFRRGHRRKLIQKSCRRCWNRTDMLTNRLEPLPAVDRLPFDRRQRIMQRHFHRGGLTSGHKLVPAALHQDLGNVAVLVFRKNDVCTGASAGYPANSFHAGFNLCLEFGSDRRATACELDRHIASPWLELKRTLVSAFGAGA
jgi:hypothetical protein